MKFNRDRCRIGLRTVPDILRYKRLVFPERALGDRAGMVPYGTSHRGSEVVRRAKIFSPGRSSVPRRECQTLVSTAQRVVMKFNRDRCRFRMGTGVGLRWGQMWDQIRDRCGIGLRTVPEIKKLTCGFHRGKNIGSCIFLLIIFICERLKY